MYLYMYAYVMAEFCMHFLASLRNKEKNAVFAIIAIWWGRGGYGYIWGGWRMGENTSVCLLTSVSQKKN